MHRTAAAIAIALSCILATAARARDLFILQAGNVSDSGHDVEELIDDFLLRRGAFSALVPAPSVTATLDYLGVPNAVRFQASALGNQVVVQIPSTGFSRAFTGTSRADVENQIENFFEDDGADELADFYEKTTSRTAIALLDGNPRSTTALFARNAFDRFGLGALRTRGGFGRDERGRFGHFDLHAKASGGGIEADHFDSLWLVDTSLTVGGDFEPGIGVYVSAIGQYRDYDDADIFDAGLELGIPITVLHPGEGNPLRWMLTPVVQTGGGVSRDLLSGGYMVGGGGVSSFGLNFGPAELTIADELLYYGGIPLGEVEGISIETQLDQWITRNGAKLALYPLGLERLSLEAGASVTNFLGTHGAVDWYVSPFAGIGVKMFDLVRMRIGWESDFGENDYAAHTGRVDFGFEF